jgi:hypothetical protein
MDAAGPTVAALFLVCHNSAGKQIARDFTKNVGVKEGETWSVGASVVMVGRDRTREVVWWLVLVYA